MYKVAIKPQSILITANREEKEDTFFLMGLIVNMIVGCGGLLTYSYSTACARELAVVLTVLP